MMPYHSYDNITIYGKIDFTNVIEVPDQLTILAWTNPVNILKAQKDCLAGLD